MIEKSFIAIDLGATSGRTILGTLKDNKIQLRELTRFPNNIVSIHNHQYWDIWGLYENIIEGLIEAKKLGVEVTSIGADTWGVDFAMIDRDGKLLGAPYSYRDPQTMNMPDEFFNLMPREKVYGKTGNQIMNFNTLFQLFALTKANDSTISLATDLLFMPDAISYLLTGKKVTEYTIASTSQILNPRTKIFDTELLKMADVNPAVFGEIVLPGHIVGSLTDYIAERTGLGKVNVVAVAGHDTASAVAAIPTETENFAFLSSGTWSLMGIEVQEPIINEMSYEQNFTNEGGVEGTTRFLKNITGMWILEECLKEWKKEGRNYSYSELVLMSNQKSEFHSYIDTDHASFACPLSMTKAITEYCFSTGQKNPTTHADFVSLIFESLAMKYKYVFAKLKEFAPFEIEKLHVIGGGSKNSILNQWTANAIGIPVYAGPGEATALGNLLVQAKAAGYVESLSEMRKIVINTCQIEKYIPSNTSEWEVNYLRYLEIIVQS